ncbi:MAG: hypothetical protein WBL44_08395 [Nitrososphaeraceae archaeon]
MTNSPYELTLDNMKNITTDISDEQNLALSIKLNGAIVVPAVKHTVRICIMPHIITGRRHFAVCTIAVIVLATIGTKTIIGAIEDQNGIKKPSLFLISW